MGRHLRLDPRAGVATGAMLGLAEWLRRTGGRRGWRWLAASPLAFAAVFLSDPLHLGAFFATGIGGPANWAPRYSP